MVSAQERTRALAAFATSFYDQISIGGIALPAELRLAIVHEARHCLLNCEGCKSLPASVCLRPGASVYGVLSKPHMKHQMGDHLKNSSAVSDSVKTVVMNLVHTIINHQNRVNRKWYDETIRHLDLSGLLPRSVGGEKRKHLLSSAFVEILSLASVASAIQLTSLGLEDRLNVSFALPPVSLSAFNHGEDPSFVDWTDLLKNGLPRRDDACFSPYLLKSDINRTSLEYGKISQRGWTEMESLMHPMNPFYGMTMAGDDLYWVIALSNLFYLKGQDVAFAISRKLDPTKYCSDSFDRFDSELIGREVAKAHDCAF